METLVDSVAAAADIHGGDIKAQKHRIAYRNGKIFGLQPHLERLLNSCKVLLINLPMTVAELTSASEEVVRRNNASCGDLRIVVSRGDGYPMYDPRRAHNPLVVISLQERPPVSYPREGGIRLVVPSTRRIPPTCLDPRVKSNNYLNHVTAKLQAIAAGADESLMLDIDGNVAELPGANVFAFNKGELITPPPSHILAGITRSIVLEMARTGVSPLVKEVVERQMTLYDIYTAEEVILTGTALGIAFASEVDGRKINGGKCGPLTRTIGHAYEKMLTG